PAPEGARLRGAGRDHGRKPGPAAAGELPQAPGRGRHRGRPARRAQGAIGRGDIALRRSHPTGRARAGGYVRRVPPTAPDIVHHARLDERMLRAASGIRLLALASWPARVLDGFLADHARGVTRLPVVEYPRHDFSGERAELEAVARAADPGHPMGAYLIESARSWETAARLCECLGTDQACDLSVRLYGHPESPLPGHGPGVRWAARKFIAVADELHRDLVSPSEQWPISATSLAMQLQRDLDDYFNERVIEVVLDPDLVAK